MIYNSNFAIDLSFADWINIFLYGLKLDISLTGYILILPIITLSTGNLLSVRIQKNIINSYTLLFLLIALLIIIADAELYRNWGFRIDKTGLLYLKTPKEAFASTSTYLILFFLILYFSFVIISYLLYNRLTKKRLKVRQKASKKNFIISIILLFSLIIPIRGGFSIATLNVSAVYFHDNMFANHAAVNAVWNVMYSISAGENEESYSFFDEKECNEVFTKMNDNINGNTNVLKAERPNILIIILESFSSKIIEPLGGEKGITPNFTELCKEGILFENFYANGSRSDKGIVSIISGFPAQPATSIIKFPNKTRNLPFINLSLKEEGYSSSFYYGGNLNFANMKSYFVNGQFDNLVTEDDFSSTENQSKWGVPDHIIFNRLQSDLENTKSPFINIIFTLSSHDPFDVPMKSKFNSNSEDDKFKNSAYYTDKSLGDFIRNAKNEEWWDSTLCILVADHGSRLPGNTKFNTLEKFQIPMLWIGGALNTKDTIISTY